MLSLPKTIPIQSLLNKMQPAPTFFVAQMKKKKALSKTANAKPYPAKISDVVV